MWNRVTGVVFACCLAMVLCLSTARADELQFNRDIRPILVETCFHCHGPDSASRAADLRLDLRDQAVEHGALVPGDAEASEIIARVLSDDPETIMPPPESHKVLTAEQKETLRRWVDEGAVYQPHWSFIAPEKKALPSVSREDWVKNPIDAFILARLDEKGLKPAEPADKRTLVRRVSLDLTGLPPEPELVEKFVNDSTENAYEKLVDELLSRSSWGEHRGRYWLDYARYADTHGIHFDNYREMWSYRDWVINAFNQNMPYDQFTIEQLAGDLLPEPTIDQQIGSGFNRCNMTTSEGGIIDEEYAVLYARDRTETYGQVFLGLTTGCAVCHDHKFDPLSQKEFYELSSFFNNTTQPVKDGNKPDTPPVIVVPQDSERDRWLTVQTALTTSQADIAKIRKETKPAFDKLLKAGQLPLEDDSLQHPSLVFHAPLNSRQLFPSEADVVSKSVGKDPTFTFGAGFIADHAVNVSGFIPVEFPETGDFEQDQPFSVAFWVNPTNNAINGAIVSRKDDSPANTGWMISAYRGRLQFSLTGTSAGHVLKVETREEVKNKTWSHILVSYDGSGSSNGVRILVNGNLQNLRVPNDQLSSSIRTKSPFRIGHPDNENQEGKLRALVQDIRLYSSVIDARAISTLLNAPRLVHVMRQPEPKFSDEEQRRLLDYWLFETRPGYPELVASYKSLEAEATSIKQRGTIAHVMHERDQPAMAYVLTRGDYDKRADEVRPQTPDILPAFGEELPKNRLGLAQWTVDEDHPLTARVAVNRFWQEVFGTGLVATTGDFGITGELPSHPELLDWLSIEFRTHDWDIKHMFKLLVMSNAYQQSSATTPEKLAADPENRLLARGPRFRMDGEMIRDTALVASGILVKKMGGPSVRPYQPSNLWEVVGMQGSDTRNYVQDHGDNLYRRSVYTFWKRFSPPPSLEIFNAPTRENCIVRRERTNTPLQALVTLNDTQFVEAARYLAEQGLKTTRGDFGVQLDYLTERLIARRFSESEQQIARDSFEELKAFYEANPTQAEELLRVGEYQSSPEINKIELAAWTMLTNQLMNLDEVLCK